PISRDQIVTESTSVPIGAFEDYIKGKLTREHDARVGFLEHAIKEYAEKANGGKYSDAYFELGRIKYDDKQYADAIEALKNVDPKSPRYDETQFCIAGSESALGQTDKALDDFNKLKGGMPLYEVFNNIGVLYLKQKQYQKALEHLKPASEASPRDTDTLFNLGYAYYLSGDYKSADEMLSRELERRANDGQAQYLLSKSLAAAGQQAEAAKASDEARRQLPEFAQWETKGIPFLGRIKEDFNKVNYYRYKRDQEQKLTPASLTAVDKPEIDQLLAAASSAFDGGRDEEALNALGKVLQAAPQSYEAHMLMGRIFERRGDTDRATNELKAALFWNPKLVEAQVMLGRIALLKDDCQAALTASTEAFKT
ncbi:MAG: tetratricopeptide repeat protein, partial [Blastocatellia bacterium]